MFAAERPASCEPGYRSGYWSRRSLLEQAKRLGTSEGELLLNFPTLRAEDLVNSWAYARSHREEVEDQIRANEEDQS